MVEQRQRSLILLARVEAAIGGLSAVAMFAFYGLQPNLVASTSTALAAAILGTTCLVYFVTFHQVIGRRSLAPSTLVLTTLTAVNFVLVIAATGGLNSPFYSLWLLAIVAAGIFGLTETVVILILTILYFVYAIVIEGLHAPFIRDHLIQLIITVAAGGLAEWVHSRSRRSVAQSSKLETLTGKLTEEQLKAQALVSSIGEGVVVVDENGQIKLFNKAAAQLTGWDEGSAQDIAYKTVLQLKSTDEKDITDANDPFKQVWAKREQVISDDLVMTTRSGRKVQLSLSVSPITDDSGALTGSIGLFRDISQEKEISRQKDEFISTASHEMRTPVAAIEGYISLAMNPNVAMVDDRAKKFLDKAHESIQHLGELFRDLLSVAKAEEGTLKPRIDAVNVSEMLRATVDAMQFVAQKKNLTLALQTSGNSPGKAISPIYYVAANPERLREVVMNLIDNAIKYTAQGGVKVVLDGDNKEVKVSIIDSGVGIATEDIPHLFQKFYRIDNSATRTIGGTGLGLYLSRQLIELFNGRIWIESKMGSGSSFIFSLPRISEEEAFKLNQAASLPVQPQEAAKSAADGIVLPVPATLPPIPQPIPEAGPALSPQPILMPIPSLNEENVSHRLKIR